MTAFQDTPSPASASDYTVDELLADPMVRLLMAFDGIGPEDARAALREAGRRHAAKITQ